MYSEHFPQFLEMFNFIWRLEISGPFFFWVCACVCFFVGGVVWFGFDQPTVLDLIGPLAWLSPAIKFYA